KLFYPGYVFLYLIYHRAINFFRMRKIFVVSGSFCHAPEKGVRLPYKWGSNGIYRNTENLPSIFNREANLLFFAYSINSFSIKYCTMASFISTDCSPAFRKGSSSFVL